MLTSSDDLVATIAFAVRGVPMPKGSTKAVSIVSRFPRTVASAQDLLACVRVTSDNIDAKAWEQQVSIAAFAATANNPSWRHFADDKTRAYTLGCVFYLPAPSRDKRPHPTTKPDLDKLVRAVGDALTGTLWRDDAQVIAATAEKRYADNVGNVRVEIVVGVGPAIAVAPRPRRPRKATPQPLPLDVESVDGDLGF